MSQRYFQGVESATIPASLEGGSNYSGVYTLDQLNRLNAVYPAHIANSLRFRSSASAYLNRTPGSGNQTTWTWSGWVKRGSVSANGCLFAAGPSSPWFEFFFAAAGGIYVQAYNGSTVFINLQTTPVYRDPSAWYHIVLAYDSTNATASNRVILYVNGVQVTAFGTATYPNQNVTTAVNSTLAHDIGSYFTITDYFDGYLADINFIDGQALAPTAFGQFYYETGVWCPMPYQGTYGTNGFHLTFANNTSTTTLGYDSSPNGNNWTTNNISLTAGSTYDWMIDSPTSFAGSSYGVGNYAVLNAVSVGVDCTLSNGNLGIAYGSSGTRYCTMGTIGMSSGKWYCEFAYTGGTTPSPIIGLSAKASSTDMIYYPGYTTSGWGYENSGLKYTNAISTSYGSTWTANDVIGIAFDADGGALTFYVNGASQGVAYTGLTSGPYYFAVGDGGGLSTYNGWINFGQRPFAGTVPSGYKSLCTQNLP